MPTDGKRIIQSIALPAIDGRENQSPGTTRSEPVRGDRKVSLPSSRSDPGVEGSVRFNTIPRSKIQQFREDNRKAINKARRSAKTSPLFLPPIPSSPVSAWRGSPTVTDEKDLFIQKPSYIAQSRKNRDQAQQKKQLFSQSGYLLYASGVKTPRQKYNETKAYRQSLDPRRLNWKGNCMYHP